MNTSKRPISLWRPDYLAVAVETVAKGCRRLPLSFSWAVVRGGRVTSVHHQPIAWWSPGEVGEDELRKAIAASEATRSLTTADLLDGPDPHQALGLLERLFRRSAWNQQLIVSHDPTGRLRNLLRVAEDVLEVAIDLPAWVNTAVLERGRQLGLRQLPRETAAAYYRRIEMADGPLPDLRACHREIGFPGDLRPGDRLFGVLATHDVYEHHRLKRRGKLHGVA